MKEKYALTAVANDGSTIVATGTLRQMEQLYKRVCAATNLLMHYTPTQHLSGVLYYEIIKI